MSGAHVLVLGRTGQVAQELARAKWEKGIQPTFLDRAAADLSRPETLRSIVLDHRPDVVIVAAAFTSVDGAESQEPLATRVNADAPAAIAAAAAELSAPIIHLSTDCVFDGEKDAPYVETDITGPINAYGRSKLAGERLVAEANPKHLILRVSWIFGRFGSNFLQTMLCLAASREEVDIVCDQFACPTPSRDLAQAVAGLALVARDPATPYGVYHLAGQTDASRLAFGEGIFGELARRGMRRPRIRAVASSDFPTPARRPPNGRLNSDRIAAALGISLPPWQEALPHVLDDMLAPA
jgi:dTDP-4-dehydrorhamnose reductase